MCLVVLAYKKHPGYPVILMANRDEFLSRPARQACFWPEKPDILAGRDEQAGGVWMGLTRQGRWGVITNFRDPASLKDKAPSRGGLVLDFLLGNTSPSAYLKSLRKTANAYNGFNLLVGDHSEAGFLASTQGISQTLTPGIFGLSNALLDTPWPKLVLAKKGMEDFLEKNVERPEPDWGRLFQVLANEQMPLDTDLPETGVGLEWERILAPIFIRNPVYGTRVSTILAISAKGKAVFEERSHLYDKPSTSVRFAFELGKTS